MTTTTANTGTGDQQQGQGDAQQPQGGTGQPQGTPTPLEAQQAAQRAAAQQQNGTGEQGDGEQGNVDDLPEWARKALTRANNQAAQYRAEKNTAAEEARATAQQEADARIQAVLQALGIDTGDGDDPEKVAEADRSARAAAEEEARASKLELAVFRAAAPDSPAAALLDSRTFLASIADADPEDSDTIKAAIDKAIEDNPRLATVQAATRSSADFTGGSGDGAITPEKFQGMDMQERNALYLSDPDTYRRLAATTK